MQEERFMKRAIDLASRGGSPVSPNPMVGAVIVKDGRIIAEGWHHAYGMSHAERDAIDSLVDKSVLRGATMYVTLEPCCHYGKTPPCADYIIENGISKVVVGAPDPNPKVAGGGFRRLREAGIEVVENFMREQCEEVCRFFLTSQRLHRPYVMLKWAQSSDGCMGVRGRNVWFTGEDGRIMTHRMRAQYDAIMVGTNTAAEDNPSLTVRAVSGPDPIRITLDRTGRLSHSLHLFDGSVRTIVFTATKLPDTVESVPIDFSADPIPQILSELHSRRIQSLMVEGGPLLLQSFIQSGMVDEVNVFRSSRTIREIVPCAIETVMAPSIPQCSRINIFDVF